MAITFYSLLNGFPQERVIFKVIVVLLLWNAFVFKKILLHIFEKTEHVAYDILAISPGFVWPLAQWQLQTQLQTPHDP